MTLQEQKNCPMISSKATVASRNSLHWSCKPLIRLRKILASRSLEKGRSPSPAAPGEAGGDQMHGAREPIPTRRAQERADLPFSRGGGACGTACASHFRLRRLRHCAARVLRRRRGAVGERGDLA